NTYLPKLVKAGQRVAICDQLEDPKQTKTIVRRGVTELVTPGVALGDDMLQAKANNFLAAVHLGGPRTGVSFLDVSTGEFFLAEGNREATDKWLQNFAPKEVLISKKHRTDFREQYGDRFHTFYLEDWVFQEAYARETLTGHFKTSGLKGFGVENQASGIVAAGAVLHYLGETQHRQLGHIGGIRRLASEDYVWMDRFTQQNLEIFRTRDPGGVALIDVVDHTRSPMGGRLLRQWLALPLKDLEAIRHRHRVVAYFCADPGQLGPIREQLRQMGDLERLIAKVAAGKITPRETVHLKNALEAVVPVKKRTAASGEEALEALAGRLDDCAPLRERIKTVLLEEAPAGIGKGRTIAPGFSAELDDLRGLAGSGKEYLEKMLRREQERTGITSLKIASNNV
ncbi:MAG TPA: hypothetical protein VLA15_10255, partial [Desulfurivibrionaceae bacterium]|nr:hypothetical protein [Desulfurivibrionaceae bacterium]